MVARRSVSPVLRWAGGKRWLVPRISELLPALRPTEYLEPFIGGASVYLAFTWPSPVLGDVNEELIATYRSLARDPETIRTRLAALPVSAAVYSEVRDTPCSSDCDRAVRLLYLNRCSYGGIYRTNRQGTFNVPYSGDRSLGPLTDTDALRRVGEAMNNATLGARDFEHTLRGTKPGAVVYCDPAYTLPEEEGHFRRYSPSAFSWSDQLRLAEIAHTLATEEACVLISNSADPRVASLFRGALVLSFERRAFFPRARGTRLHEALYVLADRNTLRRIRRRLNA
ncbi:MAG: Dam family site-specific DNA-(adenine-N6)-methyltransferase [Proteobacteria bacterium]|nr:Dam family site-specific DNA-(adenine-N6)-methyltransferase [Pseudomonadota bacterium]